MNHDLSSRISLPNRIEGENVNFFSMITRINESETLTKHIWSDCEYELDGKKCNSNQKWNKNKDYVDVW